MKPMNTKQIAEEAVEQIETDVSDVIIDKPLLIAIIQAAIEKWDESRRIQLSDYANEILRLQKELSRATHASEPITELVEALRMLRDFQNGCPLPSYEKGWNEAIRLTDDALRKYEPQSAAHASEKYKHDVRESHGAQ